MTGCTHPRVSAASPPPCAYPSCPRPLHDRHEALFLIPIYEGTIVFQSALAGTLVNRDYVGREGVLIFFYFFSLVIIGCGLYLIIIWPGWCIDGDALVPMFNRCLRPQPGSGEHLKLNEKLKPDGQKGERGCFDCCGPPSEVA